MSPQYNAQLEKTISDSNVSKAMPYIDINGDLCIVARIYSLAGADSYKETLKLKGSGSPSPINCTVDHVAQEEEPEVTEAWKQRYLSYIEDNNLLERFSSADFALVCIDNDDIPEIITSYGKLLWVSNDTVMEEEYIRINLNQFYYMEKQNKFLTSEWGYDVSGDFVYEFKNSNVELLHRGSMIKGSHYGMENSWTWDGEGVSSEQYNTLLKDAFDRDKATEATFENFAALKDAIINW